MKMQKMNLSPFTFQVQETVLLTGAGFTHNFGGFLGEDMWAQIFNHPQLQRHPRIRAIMSNDFDYESAYYKVLHMKPLIDSVKSWKEEKAAIKEAVRAAYDRLDVIVRNFRFAPDAPYPVNIFEVQKLINRFAGKNNSKGFFFTLNQDLFIERKYHNGTRPLLPGINNSNFTDVLTSNDYCKLPTQEEIDRHKNDWLKSYFFYIKLHGSQNWIDCVGNKQMVIGMDKTKQIHDEPLLSWYFEIFREVLSQPNRRLLVIGYGFRDEHVNEIIIESINKHNLKLYILSPEKPGDFGRKLEKITHGNCIWRGLYSYFPYTLQRVFPADQSTSVEFQTLQESYFNLKSNG
ncbi:SIR2 family protein [candidate division WOR-3 bacterium]|nr:SIR2 family protein [candidate division WOR-3 bacterium]